jgi:hypothetical protein
MKTFAKLAAAAALTGALAVSMASPSQAAWRHHGNWSHGDRGAAAAIGFGAGALVGAAAANAAYGPGYYDYGYAGPGYDSYAYAGPGYAYAAPVYGPEATYPYGRVNNSNINEHQCTLSPASTNYVPCLNNP